MNKNKTLLQRFVEFNALKRMAGKKKVTLLAVSGGLDSVVMCDLFHQSGFPFSIAHCNFQLRGPESDEDESFVKSLGKKYGVEIRIKKFDTQKYADDKKLSIQVVARDLRYQWFEELRKGNNLHLIATAHQLNDNIETIFYNLIKGTGIRGLRGIPVRQGNIIRPLLFASRDEIEKFANEQQLAFREDSSNAEDKYVRNKIRHHLIPIMKEINPSLENTFADKIELFTELELLYEKSVKRSSSHLFLKRKDDIYIPVAKLKKTKNAMTVLFEYLKNFGFNSSQVEDMINQPANISGKQFFSNTARVIKDRRFFIVTKLPEKDFTIKLISENDKEIFLGDKKLILSDTEFGPTPDPKNAFLDKSKLVFPLTVRRWKEGDYFYPLGMKMKKKKIKKFLIDQKVPLHEKENIWVLESENKIAWVVGYRLDERFKVTKDNIPALKIRVH